MNAQEIGAIADFILNSFESVGGDSAGPLTAVDSPGGQLYATLCAACHGTLGEGGIGGVILGEQFDAGELAALLRNGTPGMLAFPDLTEQEVAELVEHTLLLADGAVTLADTGATDEADGGGATSSDDGRTLSLFLNEDSEADSGVSLIALAVVVLVGLSVVSGVGYVWIRSARGVVR
ncbi:MAG: cytochrome c [Acidimicrobiia bacterium]|nr:cytochrome c [Acidimicrobiia bacterium]